MSLLAAVAAGAAAGALGGVLTPVVVRRLPEPEPSPSVPEDEGPKELYADVAAHAHLAPLAALGGALGGVAVALGTGWTWSLVVWLPALLVAPALTWVDWRTRLLPSLLVLPATAAAVVLGLVGWGVSGSYDDLVRAAIALVMARSVFWALWWIRSAGMGFGDVRLSALLGFALGHQGWGELLVGLYTGFLVFGLPGLALALWRRDRTLLKAAFPFGPAMLVGAALGAWFGGPLAAGLAGG
ncbi:prepilin peptidase [Nocardioides taihuensis]|uniref:Prepilin peptidase n=1 Tax=Nocardioides taihuensis TaxID=1835606 RepID=A0ABW0BQY0_9ACTN